MKVLNSSPTAAHPDVRRSPLLLACFAALTLVGCGGGGGGPAQAPALRFGPSNLCPELAGGEGLIWDIYNGVIRTDPGLPPPVPVGGSFGHPAQPLLGFSYPAGWNPETLGDGSIHNVGVNVFRADGQALWRNQSATIVGNVSARAVRDQEISTMLQVLGQTGATVQTVCVNERQAQLGGGFVADISNVFIRFGNHTAVIVANVIPTPGLGSSSVSVKVVMAPTAEFGARAYDTYLAIDWQMSFGEDANLFDTDGDGWRDGVDMHYLDPTRH